MIKEKIHVNNNKTLKLNNVLSKELVVDKMESFDKEVLQMDNYIKSRGAQPLGPLIQYMSTKEDDDGLGKLVVCLLRQSSVFLHNIDYPYSMKSLLKINNCMYARFIGNESKIRFAYDKLNLIAFENDFDLKGNSYTVFVSQNDDEIVADIFMERVDND